MNTTQTAALLVLFATLPPPLWAGFDARFVGVDLPGAVEAGQRFTVAVTFENRGASAWRENGGIGSIRLGARNPDNNTIWRGDNRVKLAPNEVIPPQVRMTKTFSFEVIAPPTPGTYGFQWQMLQEGGIGFFGDRPPVRYIRVTPSTTDYSIITVGNRPISIAQITNQGRRLLTGTGLYLICSKTGSDDPDTNYSSHQSADGIRMRNGRGENGPTFSFVFDRTIPGRLLVRAEIGPSDRVYRELNLAMDFDSLVMASYEFSPVQGILTKKAAPMIIAGLTDSPVPFPVSAVHVRWRRMVC